jgi:hypothetical protein
MGLAATSEVLVGTWVATWCAIRFYEKHGFHLLPMRHKTSLGDTEVSLIDMLRLRWFLG